MQKQAHKSWQNWIPFIAFVFCVCTLLAFLLLSKNEEKTPVKCKECKCECPNSQKCPELRVRKSISAEKPKIENKKGDESGFFHFPDSLRRCSNDFEKFKFVYWPAFLENECGLGRENNCCVNDPKDAGGFTCYGVAIKHNHDFYKYLKAIGYDLNKEKALKINSEPVETYAQLKIYMGYFKKPKIEELPSSLREVVFDNAVHSGPTKAIKLLQKLCKVKADGHIGQKTINACKGIKANDYISARKKWLQTRKSWKNYSKGFKARLERQKEQAIESLSKEKICS